MAETSIIITAVDETKEAFASVGKGLDVISGSASTLNGVIALLSPLLGAASISEFAKYAIDAGDELFILSQKTGIAVETLAGLELAGKMNSVSLEDMAVGVKKLSVYMFDAAKGGAEQQKMLHLLGVTAKEPLPAMGQIADKFATMSDGAEKSALAVAIFGRAGTGMIPVLNGGGAALRDMIEEGKKLNPVTAEFAEAANNFNDNLDRMSARAKGNAFVFANELLPSITNLQIELLKSGDSFSAFKMAGKGVAEVLNTLVVLGANTGYVFKEVGNEIGGMGAQLAALAHGDFEGFGKIREMMIADGESARAEIDRFSESVINGSKKIQEASSASPKGKDNSIANQLNAQKLIDEARKADEAMLGSHKDAFTKYIEAWKKTEDVLVGLGAAGTSARIAHERAYTEYVNAESKKQITDAQKKLDGELGAENDYFNKLNAAESAFGASQKKRNEISYQDDVNTWLKKYELYKSQHRDTLDEEKSFQDALENIRTVHSRKDNDEFASVRAMREDIDTGHHDKQISGTLGYLTSLTSLNAAHNKDQFEANKIFSIAKATVDTYTAASAAFSDAGGGWYGAAMAAASIAFGLAQVASIESTSFGGGGSGGGSPSMGGAGVPSYSTNPGIATVPQSTTGVAAAPAQQINLTLYGVDPGSNAPQFTYDQVVNQLLPLLSQANGNGAVAMNVTMA